MSGRQQLNFPVLTNAELDRFRITTQGAQMNCTLPRQDPTLGLSHVQTYWADANFSD
jgi:hypothetical protein